MPGLKIVNQPADPVVLREDEPGIEIHRDCVYVPIELGNFWENPYWGVYDRNGQLIEAAAFRSLPGMRLTGQSPTCIAEIGDVPYAPRDLYFYVGNIIPQYGHFLLSSMARLWALQRYRLNSVPLIAHAAGGPDVWFSLWPLVRTLFGAAGVVREDFADFRKPVRIRELVVAYPSFVELNLAHRTHAEAAHEWGDRLAKTQDLSGQLDIVYVSKTRNQHLGALTNEAMLEAALERAGVPIVYPEQLPVPEQIALFRRTKTVLGQAGSAFHTSIFSKPPNGQVLVQMVPSPHVYSTNHALMDLANRNRSFYIHFECIWHEGEAHPVFELVGPETAALELLNFARQVSPSRSQKRRQARAA